MNINYAIDAECDACSNLIADMWCSLDTAINASEFVFELNVYAYLQHIVSTRYSRVRVPIDFEALQDCAVFVNRVLSDETTPPEITHMFKLMQSMLYQCCGYSKVKFNGRRTDS